MSRPLEHPHYVPLQDAFQEPLSSRYVSTAPCFISTATRLSLMFPSTQSCSVVYDMGVCVSSFAESGVHQAQRQFLQRAVFSAANRFTWQQRRKTAAADTDRQHKPGLNDVCQVKT